MNIFELRKKFFEEFVKKEGYGVITRIAANFECKPANISQFLSGKRRITDNTLKKLAPACNLNPEDFDKVIESQLLRDPIDKKIVEYLSLLQDEDKELVCRFIIRLLNPAKDAPCIFANLLKSLENQEK